MEKREIAIIKEIIYAQDYSDSAKKPGIERYLKKEYYEKQRQIQQYYSIPIVASRFRNRRRF